MLFYKVITNYIRIEKLNYNKIIKRRKERFIQLVELGAPKEIIIKEVELLRQPFKYYLRKRIQRLLMIKIDKIYKYTI